MTKQESIVVEIRSKETDEVKTLVCLEFTDEVVGILNSVKAISIYEDISVKPFRLPESMTFESLIDDITKDADKTINREQVDTDEKPN